MIKSSARNKVSASGKGQTYSYPQGKSQDVIRTKVNTSCSGDSFLSAKKPHSASIIRTKASK